MSQKRVSKQTANLSVSKTMGFGNLYVKLVIIDIKEKIVVVFHAIIYEFLFLARSNRYAIA